MVRGHTTQRWLSTGDGFPLGALVPDCSLLVAALTTTQLLPSLEGEVPYGRNHSSHAWWLVSSREQYPFRGGLAHETTYWPAHLLRTTVCTCRPKLKFHSNFLCLLTVSSCSEFLVTCRVPSYSEFLAFLQWVPCSQRPTRLGCVKWSQTNYHLAFWNRFAQLYIHV